MTVMDYEDPALPEPLPDSEQAEAMAHDALVYELSCALMRLDGNDGDPHHLLWTGGTVPEPWGDAWQRYEPQAEAVLNAIGEGSANALVEALSEREWVAEVASSGPHNFPLLQWRSADVSLGTSIGTKLYLHPLCAAGVLAQPTGKTTDADGVAAVAATPAICPKCKRHGFLHATWCTVGMGAPGVQEDQRG